MKEEIEKIERRIDVWNNLGFFVKLWFVLFGCNGFKPTSLDYQLLSLYKKRQIEGVRKKK